MIQRSGNPALNDKTFKDLAVTDYTGEGQQIERMTLAGTVNKTAMMLVMVLITASFVWAKVFTIEGVTVEAVSIYPIVGAIGGLIFALITAFKHTWAPVTAPIYALLEGLFIGGISAIMEVYYPGIVMQATMLTFGVLFALLMAYKSGMIRATENFKLGVMAATGGVFLLYMATFILGMFGVNMPFIHDTGPMGIGLSVVIVIIAALNLVLDFDFIENAAEKGAPKYMEWVGAFGLMVTLIWLYIEILHLLSKLRSND